jgi:hypothetical protein
MGGAVPPLPNTPSWRGPQGGHRVFDRDTFIRDEAMARNLHHKAIKCGHTSIPRAAQPLGPTATFWRYVGYLASEPVTSRDSFVD